MQRIVIKNLGPIKEVDIPIHDLTILIGPQASGKSTIAKAIWLFNKLPYSVFAPLVNDIRGSLDDLKKIIQSGITQRIEEDLLKLLAVEYQTFYSQNFEILFSYSDKITINYIVSDGVPKVFLSKTLDKIISDYLSASINDISIEEDMKLYISRAIRNSFWNFVYDLFNLGREITFVPAGRNLFSILSNQIQFFNNTNIDYTVTEFASIINSLRSEFGINYFKEDNEGFIQVHSDIENLAIVIAGNILKGTFTSENQFDKIALNEIESILLSKASSGQQESLWVLLVLLNSIKSVFSVFNIIEEPEAHLYPEAQKSISELIALSINQPNSNGLITTHSPYILSALNNLLYANEVGKSHPDQVDKIVDKNLWLDYDRVMAYFVDEGGVRSIMDDELRLIKSEEIDSASRIINEEYDNLADIKYAK